MANRSYEEDIVSRTKSTSRSDCVKATHESFVVRKTRRQHQKTEDLMACAYKVKTSWIPALRYLLLVSYKPNEKEHLQRQYVPSTHKRRLLRC